MDRQILNFTANEQMLTVDEPIRISTNKVNYIEAHFALGTNWSGYDSVRAVWFNDYQTISTVLDSQGVCRVPFEVMKRKGQVKVDLVGSISENDVLTDRLTSYPVVAVIVDCIAQITGAETSPITPSQFEQFVANVRADADRAEAGATSAETSAGESEASATASAQSATASANSASQAQTYSQNAQNSAISAENAKDDAEEARDEILGMRATANTLAEGSDATASYSNGLLTLGIPRGNTGAKGAKGDTGATPNLSIGTVETLPPTGSSEVTITGTAENPVLNFKLVKGDTGEVTMAQLTNLKSEISDISVRTYGVNLFDNNFDESGYINRGADASSSSFKRTSKYYPIGGENNGYLYIYLSESVDTFTIALYDASKTFISNKTIDGQTQRAWSLPSNAHYFRIYTRTAFDGTATLALSKVTSYIPYVAPKAVLKDDIVGYGNLKSELKDLVEEKNGTNIFDNNFDESGYINRGADASGSNYVRTSKYYPVDASKINLYSYHANSTPSMAIVFYDSSKTWISNTAIGASGAKTITIPSNASYYRLYKDVAYTEGLTIAYTPVTSYIPYEAYYGIKDESITYSMFDDDVKQKIGTWLYGKNIVFMGDSLIGNFYDSTGICAKLANITGASITNCAFGGTQMALRNSTAPNMVYWNQFSGCSLADAIADNDFTNQDDALANMTGALSYFSDRLTTLKGVDWNAVDILMWEWGVNDFQNGLVVIKDENDLTSLVSYYGAYCHTIETILTAYPHLRIIPITPMWRCWLDADDDHYLYGSDEHEIANQLLPNFAKCAVEVAEKYHLPVINNYFEMDANPLTYTQYFSGHDGVHPNENGRSRIADRIAHKIVTLL